MTGSQAAFGGVLPPAWVADAVFYAIVPDRFRKADSDWPIGSDSVVASPDRCGGDLRGVIEALDTLSELGVNALYLTPIFTARSYHRYDTVDYFTVDPGLGGNAALARLISAAHERRMRLLLDGVFNHCGDAHPFFLDARRNGQRSPYWDWFTINGPQIVQSPTPNYACWAGVPGLPEWNHRHPPVVEHLVSVARHWIREADIDGWRLDAVDYLPVEVVTAIRRAAKQENPDAYVLGEVMGTATSWFKSDALDGVMHYRLRDGIVHLFASRDWDAPRFAAYARHLLGSYPPANTAACYTLLGSHDKPRFLTLCHGDVRRLLLATAFLFAHPGAPALYYGDEIGMRGGEDPDCRRPFPWDRGRWNLDLREAVRRLVALRRREPGLRRGSIDLSAPSRHLLTVDRRLNGDELLAVFNLSENDAHLDRSGQWSDLLAPATEEETGISVPGMGYRFMKRVASRSSS